MNPAVETLCVLLTIIYKKCTEKCTVHSLYYMKFISTTCKLREITRTTGKLHEFSCSAFIWEF